MIRPSLLLPGGRAHRSFSVKTAKADGLPARLTVSLRT
jgi:hypothetical protein